MKAIRTREERLEEIRNRRKNVGSKADAAERKLSKMGTEVSAHHHTRLNTNCLNLSVSIKIYPPKLIFSTDFEMKLDNLIPKS